MEERFETFTVLLAKISRSIRKIKNFEMKEYGLRSSHVSCLYYLFLSEGITATELCERCEEDKATVSRSLTHLEDNGYILRNTESSKRYKNPLTLTEKGKEAGKRIATKIEGALDEISNGFSEEERSVLYHTLTVISSRLESIEHSYEKNNLWRSI